MAVDSPDNSTRAQRRKRRTLDGLLLLDKPTGMSSNSALLEVRQLFQAQKAGHTGTLDPLASGLLPICMGQTAKLSGLLLDSAKRYSATVRLGQKTATGDSEGEVTATSDPAGITLPVLQTAALAFTGLIQQTPPMYSAIKVEGTRLYALAREGLEVPREPRTVEILQLIIAELHEGCFRMDVTCSKGTYIRTLAEDIATSVGQVAHLTALRRLSVGGHLPEQMHTLDSIKQASLGGYEALDALLLPSITLLSQARQFVITPEQSAELFLGRDPPTEVGTTAGEVVFMNEAGLLMGLGAVIDLGMGLRSLHAHRWFDGIR